MKKFKLLQAILLFLVLIFSLIFPSCDAENKKTGVLCTLQEAYDNGWLTKEDLETAAEFHANKTNCPTPLDPKLEKNILTVYAQHVNEDPIFSNYTDLTADDVCVDAYYGTYNNCTIVNFYINSMMFQDYYQPHAEKAAGVEFWFGNPGKARFLFAYYEE